MNKQYMLVGILLTVLAAASVFVFDQLGQQLPNLAVDWHMFWRATHVFQINYIKWIFNPPWTLVFLWPISSLSVHQSWGLLVFITVLSIASLLPRQYGLGWWAFWLLFVASSYPFVRLLFEGNIEFLVLLGFLLLPLAQRRRSPWLLALSLLLLTSKIQVSWLVLLALLPHLWLHWPRQVLLQSGVLLACVCLPFLAWKGADWLHMLHSFPHHSAYNLALVPSLLRLGVDSQFAWLAWGLLFVASLGSLLRLRGSLPAGAVGALSAAGPLLAPYAGNSTLIAPLLLAAVPFAAQKPWPRSILVFLYALPMWLLWNFQVIDVYAYFAAVLCLTWACLAKPV